LALNDSRVFQEIGGLNAPENAPTKIRPEDAEPL